VITKLEAGGLMDMSLEQIKREFIQFMEEIHSGNPYPRNFYGCLIPIIIEPGPVSQERIMELTGYSQGTISMTIQKIQLLMPVKTVKIIGDRKRYYDYSSPKGFIIDLTHNRVNVQDVDIASIEPLLDRVRHAYQKNKIYKRFLDYLNNLLLYLRLIHEIRTTSANQLENILNGGKYNQSDFYNPSVLENGPLAEFIQKMREASTEYNQKYEPVNNTPKEYEIIKSEFFSRIKSNFNPLYSQVLANQFNVIHSVILDRCTTQEEVERSTLLPRSTVSEMLQQAVKRGIIRVRKEKGSRIKYYEPAISFPDLMLSYFDRALQYIQTMKKRLSEFAKDVRLLDLKTEEAKKFLDFLKTLKKGYELSYAFSINMKVEVVKRLKQEFDRGFEFI